MIKKITITSEGYFDKITFSREKNSPYIDMEFNYHNGCRYSSFKLEDMIKVIEILNETDLPNIKDGKEVDIGHSYVYKTDCCGDRYIKAEEVKYLLKNERNDAIDEFARKLYKGCNEMIKQTWGSNTAPMSWAEAYANFKVDIDEIAEQLKDQEK